MLSFAIYRGFGHSVNGVFLSLTSSDDRITLNNFFAVYPAEAYLLLKKADVSPSPHQGIFYFFNKNSFSISVTHNSFGLYFYLNQF